MVEVRKVDPSMFEHVYSSLLRSWPDSSMTRDLWQRLFNSPWANDEDHVGYVLKDENQIVGYLGLLYSRRIIDGREEKFCNPTSWIVKDDYRSSSLNLIWPLLHLKDYTVVLTTPVQEHVYQIWKNLGFKEYEHTIYVLLPIPTWRGIGRRDSVRIVEKLEEIESIVDVDSQKKINDHASLDCRFLLLQGESSNCLIIYTLARRKGIYFTCIQFMSDPHLFTRHINKIRLTFFRRNKTIFTVVDDRMVGENRLGLRAKLRFRMLYKSKRILAEQLADNLYTEMVLLNL